MRPEAVAEPSSEEEDLTLIRQRCGDRGGCEVEDRRSVKCFFGGLEVLVQIVFFFFFFLIKGFCKGGDLFLDPKADLDEVV